MDVLVVDDCAQIRSIVSEIVLALGLGVLEAENGQVALAQFKAHQPVAVITDVNMPVMDGLAFVERLRAVPEGDIVPVIFLSSDDRQANLERARACGASAWLDKPLSPHRVATAILNAIGLNTTRAVA